MTDSRPPDSGEERPAPLSSGDIGASDTGLPSRIGQYRILRKLGEGGMGVVYEAAQDSPRRHVAVKVVRGGEFVDEAKVRQFQREADVLARLRHPQIGGIYESGRTSGGQHFFAMELVQGDTLGEFLEKRGAVSDRDELRLRLELMRRIANAVHYAHLRGVIHRDLKPSNIIITPDVHRPDSSVDTTGNGLPDIKVLDFGVARLVDVDQAAPDLSTEAGVLKGTLPYMSPEQARGKPDELDARSDVYSLGVILYELLAGQRPHDIRNLALVDAVRVICEKQQRPLRAVLAGSVRIDTDLETIVAKALAKDVEQRYASAAELADDLERYLHSLPIQARPPGGLYLLRLFMRRNRALTAVIGTVILSVTVGLVVSLSFWRTAVLARNAEGVQKQAAQENAALALDRALVATRQSERAQAISQFLIQMLSSATPDLGGNVDFTVREAIDVAARRLDAGSLTDQASLRVTLRRLIASAYASIGLYEEAVEQYQQALDPIDDTPREQEKALDAQLQLGGMLRRLDRLQRAEQRYLETRQRIEDAFGPEHRLMVEVRIGLASLHRDRGQFEQALEISEQALALAHDLGLDPAAIANTLNDLSLAQSRLGLREDAMLSQEEAVEYYREAYGDSHFLTGTGLSNLASLQAKIDPELAEDTYQEALAILRAAGGERHLTVAASLNMLGNFYVTTGNVNRGQECIQEALDIRRERLDPDHPLVANSLNNLATVAFRLRHYQEAAQNFAEALRIYRKTRGDDHPSLGTLRSNLAVALWSLNRRDESIEQLREALRIHELNWGPEHEITQKTRADLAALESQL